MVSSSGRLQHSERSSRRIEQGKKREAGEKGDIVCREKIICTVNGRIIKCFTKSYLLQIKMDDSESADNIPYFANSVQDQTEWRTRISCNIFTRR